jgi:putative ABC transport system substrate-binding protein
MRRRDFFWIAGGAAIAWPLAARAQEQKQRLVGVLMATSEDDPESRDRFNAFRQKLSEAGWAEGRNLRIESRWISGEPERARTYAAELVGLKPDLILANTALALQPLRQIAGPISIVFVLVYDPVTSGFVASLAHPGGTMTGFTLGEFSYGGKMVETLRGVAPEIHHMGVLMNPDQRPHLEMWRAIEDVAPAFKVRLTALHVRTPADLEPEIKSFVGEPNRALVVLPSPITEVHRKQVVALAAGHRLPAIYGFRSFVMSGGLVSFGIDTTDAFRRSAVYVARILNGAKPAELPVEHPTKVELVINLKTAKALGLTVPQSILARADEVIE